MSKTIEMEVFKAGKQTDSEGNTKVWTESDLDKIIKSTEKVGEDVPATLGHPKDDSPAFGWFGCKKLVRKGKSLFAVLGEITQEFAEALKRKNFKNRSIALRPDFSIRHIAFLGGTMPAVKGMSALKFEEDDKFNEYEFDFSDVETPESFADKVLKILKLKKKQDFNESDPNNPDNGGDNMDFKEQFEAEKAKNEKLTTDLEAAQAALKDEDGKEFKEKFEEEKKRADGLQTDIETAKAEAKSKEYNDFAEELIKDKKILPAEKDAIVAMQKTLDGQEAIDFAEGDKTVKKTPLEIYKKGFEAKSVGSLFGEKFNGNASPREAAEKEIKAKTEEIMEKEGISFGEAGRKLREKEPGLFKDLEFTEPEKK